MVSCCVFLCSSTLTVPRIWILNKHGLCIAALFAAVEFGQVEKARTILEDNEVDINRYVKRDV